MALFKDFFSSSNLLKDKGTGRDAASSSDDANAEHRGPETMPVPMNLEERMAFRRELLYESIRTSLNSRFIAPNSYRFKAMRTDKRGHCFVVMLDMSPSFLDSPAGQRAGLMQTADELIKNAQTKYGLQVGGVYWRADETLDVNVANWAKPVASASRPHVPSTASERQSNIDKFEAVTAEEMAEFEAAWQKDSAIRVGDRSYSSDMAPLTDEPRK